MLQTSPKFSIVSISWIAALLLFAVCADCSTRVVKTDELSAPVTIDFVDAVAIQASASDANAGQLQQVTLVFNNSNAQTVLVHVAYIRVHQSSALQLVLQSNWNSSQTTILTAFKTCGIVNYTKLLQIEPYSRLTLSLNTDNSTSCNTAENASIGNLGYHGNHGNQSVLPTNISSGIRALNVTSHISSQHNLNVTVGKHGNQSVLASNSSYDVLVSISGQVSNCSVSNTDLHKCKFSGECISKELVNDGYMNCADSSDEQSDGKQRNQDDSDSSLTRKYSSSSSSAEIELWVVILLLALVGVFSFIIYQCCRWCTATENAAQQNATNGTNQNIPMQVIVTDSSAVAASGSRSTAINNFYRHGDNRVSPRISPRSSVSNHGNLRSVRTANSTFQTPSRNVSIVSETSFNTIHSHSVNNQLRLQRNNFLTLPVVNGSSSFVEAPPSYEEALRS